MGMHIDVPAFLVCHFQFKRFKSIFFSLQRLILPTLPLTCQRLNAGASGVVLGLGDGANQCHYGDMRLNKKVSCDIKLYLTVSYKMSIFRVIRIQYPNAV